MGKEQVTMQDKEKMSTITNQKFQVGLFKLFKHIYINNLKMKKTEYKNLFLVKILKELNTS